MPYLLDPALFWMLFGSYRDAPIRWEPWQVHFLRDYNMLRALEKCPQIGFSFMCAAEAVWLAICFDDADTGFISVDQREAQNKITYARELYDGLPAFMKDAVEIVTDNTEEIVFGTKIRQARLTSFPQSSGIRGRTMHVYVDEADFLKDGGEDVYRAGLTRGLRGYRFTMGGTIFGEGTKLDEVMHHPEGGKTRFSRYVLPWTCIVYDRELREGILTARGELPEDQAREEFDAERGAGGADTFSPALMRAVQAPQPPLRMAEWNPAGPAVLGFDVGKSRHPSVATGLERVGGVWRAVVQEEPRDARGELLSLPEQEGYLRAHMERIPQMTLTADVAGLGAQIGDAMSVRFGSRFIALNSSANPAPGTAPWGKYELVTEARRALEAREVEVPADLTTVKQFRNTRLVSGGRVEQPGSRHRTHYDRFWSWCYAWYGVHGAAGVRSVYGTKNLIVVGG